MLPSVKAKKHYERSRKPCEIWWDVNVGIACEGNIIPSGHLLTCLMLLKEPQLMALLTARCQNTLDSLCSASALVCQHSIVLVALLYPAIIVSPTIYVVHASHLLLFESLKMQKHFAIPAKSYGHHPRSVSLFSLFSLFSQKVVIERIICYEVVPSYYCSFLLFLPYRVDAVPSYIVPKFHKQSHCALDNNAMESENPTSQYHFSLGSLPEIYPQN
jgi:hypothetical protein